MLFILGTKLPSDGPPADNRKRAGMALGLPPPLAGSKGQPLSDAGPQQRWQAGREPSCSPVHVPAGTGAAPWAQLWPKGWQRCWTGTGVSPALVQAVTRPRLVHVTTLRVPAGTCGVSFQPPGHPGLLGAAETKRCSDEGIHSPSASIFLLSIYFVPGTFLGTGTQQ